MQRALAEVLVLGALAGAVGVLVVLRRLAFVGDALTHTVFPGVVIAHLLGRSLLAGALAFGVLTAVLLTGLGSHRRVGDDAALAILLTSFFSLGVVLISRTRGFTADLTVFLFGRVLAIDRTDLVQTLVVAAVAALVLAVLHKELVLRAFDPEAAAAMGYRTRRLDLVLNLLIALVVVAAVEAVGTVLVIALIVVPAAAARLLADRVAAMTALACLLGAAGGWLGLAISYEVSVDHDLRLAAGATIVVVLVGLFLVAAAVAPLRRRLARDRVPAVAPMSLLEVFGDSFARRALLEAVMVGGLCGAVGVHVLLRRLPFFTMALGHATFPGVVLAALLGISLFAGAAAFGAVVVVVVALLGARDRVDDTSAVGVTLSGAFALGVLLLSAQAGFSRDLTAYLVGSIITVQVGDLVTTALVGAAVLAALAALHKELVLGAFDRGGLAALGYPVLALDVVLLLLIEATVVTSIPAVGTILAVALIVAPAATARLWTERLRATMALAAVLGATSGVVGLAISLQWRVAAGATIVLVAAALFAVSLVVAPRHGLLARRPAALVPVAATTTAAGQGPTRAG